MAATPLQRQKTERQPAGRLIGLASSEDIEKWRNSQLGTYYPWNRVMTQKQADYFETSFNEIEETLKRERHFHSKELHPANLRKITHLWLEIREAYNNLQNQHKVAACVGIRLYKLSKTIWGYLNQHPDLKPSCISHM